MVNPAVAALAMVIALGSGVASATSGSHAELEASTTIDLVFACAVSLQAGVRGLDVSAVFGVRDTDNLPRWRWRSAATVGGSPFASFLWIQAGVSPPTSPSERNLGVDSQQCKARTARVRLASGDLVGYRASQFRNRNTAYAGERVYVCRVPRAVLVRVRAVFRAPTAMKATWRFGQRVLTTTNAAIVREAELAVRTEAGKQLAYAQVLESGIARLFTARGCAEGR